MTSRMLVAAWSVVAFSGAALAQTPVVKEVNQAPVAVNGGAAPAAAGNLAGSIPPPLTEAPPAAACCSDGGDCHAPCQRFWLTTDYLVGWIQGGNLPAMVTTSPAGTPSTAAGILGSPTTSVLFGGAVNDEARSGFRIDSGYWFNHDATLAVYAGYMMLESQDTGFSASSPGTPILARPFTDATTGLPQANLIAFPGSSAGAVALRERSGNFMEGHAGMMERLLDTGNFRLFPMFGYRFFRYDEGLRVRQSISPTGGAFVPGTTVVSGDDFAARNEFNGANFGLQTQVAWRSLSLNLLTQVAAGKLHRIVDINGSTTTTVPGAAPVTAVGGLYALSSNIGHFPSNDWTVLPEFGLTFGWQVRPHVQVRLGYTLLLLNDIARAAGQIDQTVNPGLLPPATGTGPARPTFDLVRQDIWLQAASVGVQYTF